MLKNLNWDVTNSKEVHNFQETEKKSKIHVDEKFTPAVDAECPITIFSVRIGGWIFWKFLISIIQSISNYLLKPRRRLWAIVNIVDELCCMCFKTISDYTTRNKTFLFFIASRLSVVRSFNALSHDGCDQPAWFNLMINVTAKTKQNFVT